MNRKLWHQYRLRGRCKVWHRAGWRKSRHPAVETLEDRLVLTAPAVFGVYPLECSHTAPLATDISVRYDQPIDPATVSPRSFAVHGKQTGHLLDPPNTLGVWSGDTANLTPAQPFHPGELVQATVTKDIASLSGESPDAGYVWQFRAGGTSGSGVYVQSDQRLGSLRTFAVALGDLDGDGDLDAFVGNDASQPNEIWLNDGTGRFADTGQVLGQSTSRAVVLGDVDGDGDLDAVVGNDGADKVWLNDGAGTFIDSGQSLGDSLSAAVALGDLDADGDLDAVIASRVWRNDGIGMFTESGQNLGALMITTIALGDLDGDGDLDALLGSSAENTVWLNRGDAVFLRSEQTLSSSDSSSVTLGDLDGDGDLDAFVGNAGTTGEPNNVWLNDGDGRFADSGQALGSSISNAVALGDLDGDGDLDAFVGNGGLQSNRVWLNDGAGFFHDGGQALGASWSQAVALGDLDGDSDLDALVGNRYATRVWMNADVTSDLSIDITDHQEVIVPGQSLTYTITVTNQGPDDVTGATITDVVSPKLFDVSWTCVTSLGSACIASDTVDIRGVVDLLAGGAATYTVTGTVARLAVGTLQYSADVAIPVGALDLQPGNNAATDIDRITVLPLVDLDPEPNSFTAPVGTNVLVRYDENINGGSVTDQSFVVHAMQTGQLLQPPNLLAAGGNMIILSPARPLHAGELVQATATSHVETHAWEPATPPLVWQFRAEVGAGNGLGSGLFAECGRSLGDAVSLAVALGDVDGDGDLDALLGNAGSLFGQRANTLWLNDGSGAFTDSGQRLGNLASSAVALGDLNGDGYLDAVVGNRRANTIWMNDGSGTLTDSGQGLGGLQNRAGDVALGDLDRDGDLDIVFATYGLENWVWLNDGLGTFSNSGQQLGDSASRAVALGDLDEDGDLDALVGNDGEPSRVWLNDGQGRFSDSGHDVGHSQDGVLEIGDLDGDGDLDALIGKEVWLGDGQGSFVSTDQRLATNSAAALADVDGDGDLDIVAPHAVWLNTGQGAFQTTSQSLGGGSGVAIGDLDGDGDLDVVVANDAGPSTVRLNVAADNVVDLAITNTDGHLDVVPGQTVAYTIRVTNEGPNDVVGAVVTDSFPSLLTNVSWTCTASPGSSCTASGTGDINETIDLRTGGTATFIATTTVDPAATTPSNFFSNVVSVTVPVSWIDRLPQNNTATDTNRLPRATILPSDNPGFAFSPPIGLDIGGVTEGGYGDVDGDGDLDIVTGDSVWLNTGQGAFLPTSQSLGGGDAMALGDLDKDGELDAVIANDDGISVLLNQGLENGIWLGFTSPVYSAAGDNPTETIIRDLDGNGDLDLVVASSAGISARLGRGDGTFMEAVSYTTGDGSRSVAAGDLDGDGDVDLVVGNESSGNVSVLQGEGDGTFEEQPDVVSFEDWSGLLALGDVDADGDLDLVAANYCYDGSVLLGTGDGTFEPEAIDFRIEEANLTSLAISDVDGDGNLDVAVSSSHKGAHDPPGGGWVLPGNGDGSFKAPLSIGGGSSSGISIADFNGDGRLDLMTSRRGIIASVGVTLLLGKLDKIFDSESDYYPAGQVSSSVMSADLDGNGHPDLVSANRWSDNVSVLLGNGDGTFSPEVRYAVGDHPTSVICGDIDGDGDLDLVSANDRSDDVSVLLGNGDGTFAQQVRYEVGDGPRMVVLSDLDGDGDLDLVWANGSDDVSVLLGNGDGTFAQHVRYAVGNGPGMIVTGDFDNDGDLDLVSANNGSGDVSVLLGNGNGTFSQQVRYAVGDAPNMVVAGDFDNDGDLDLVSANGGYGGSNDVSVLLGSGDGTFAQQVRYAVGEGPRMVVSSDVNGDGDLDLVSANYGSGDVSVLLGNGDGTFAQQVRYAAGNGPQMVVADDLDNDGDLDLVVTLLEEHGWGRYTAPGVSILLGGGDGLFAPATVRFFASNGTANDLHLLAMDDVDGDHDRDLILTVKNGLHVVRNLSWDRHVVGDMDRDGNVDSDDIPLFQLGLTDPIAYEEIYGVPASFSGDIDGDGDLDFDDVDGFVAIVSGQQLGQEDANGDGDVSGVAIGPFVDVLVHGPYNTTVDINQDGTVDGLDVDPFVAILVGGTASAEGDSLSAREQVNRSWVGGGAQRPAGLPLPQPLPTTLPDSSHFAGKTCVPATLRGGGHVTPCESLQQGIAEAQINEIMYHPASDDSREEYIELLNPGPQAVHLGGWRFSNGVDFVFPEVTLPAGEYLVVAADVAAFVAKYPDVTDVVGGWTGRLSNRGETIELVDALGSRVDRVRYADQGDWAVRVPGSLDQGHRGWTWQATHDGDGSSLELINASLPNEHGQNWGGSVVIGGTPGRANSVATADIPPLILDVTHVPVIPQPADSVYVTARLVDELPTGNVATLHYRKNAALVFGSQPMEDDGQHGDGKRGDGVFGAVIPPQPAETIVEFYVEAHDSGGRGRLAPAVVADGESANLLYQVLDTPDLEQGWDPEDQPITYLILTDAERLELADIGDGPISEAASNAQMNGTFIRVGGTGTEVRYNVGIRNRGGASRVGPPNNYRVNVPHDRPWNGVTQLNINSRDIHAQVLGSAIYRLAGIPAAEAMPIHVRVNGRDLAEPAGPRMFGSYAQLEVINSQFPDKHFPDDRRGNLYRGFLQGAESGDLRFEGPEADAYRDTYSKETNEDADDWSDLIQLTNVLSHASEETFLEELRQVIDVDEWMRFLALDSLLGNLEFGLSMGAGDNYWLYRGVDDPRFVIVPHDLDTILGRARSGQPNRSIFVYTAVPGLSRLLTHPDTVPLYYQAYLDLIETVYNPETLYPLFDQALAGFVPQEEIDEMKQFVVDRTAGILAQIPTEFTISSRLPVVGGYHRTTQPVAELEGTADAVRTRSVLVGGQPAEWSPLSREWSVTAIGQGHTELLVAEGATWRYLDDGSNQGRTWHRTVLDDSMWRAGPAPLGYGNGDEATVVSFGPNPHNKFITTYLRHEFDVASVTEITDLTLRLNRDDGAIVYLNGQEILRSNLPEGEIDFETVASTWVGGAMEDQFFSFSIDPQLLHDGANLLAVEVHQRSAIDSDVRFDLSLEANVGVITGGVPLHPGINRIVVEAFGGPEGTGELVTSGYLDIWYDGLAEMPPDGVGDPPGSIALPVIPGGALAEDTVLVPFGPAYRVAGDVVVPEGLTLTILPGTTVLFEENTGITVDGGRLVAEGAPYDTIRLTRVPGTSGAWDGIQLTGSNQDNRISHAIFEYGVTESGMIGLVGSSLVLDHVTLDHTDRFRVRSVDSSLIVRNSTFTDIFGPDQPPTTDNRSEHIWASGIAHGGQLLIENNYFGTTRGHNDAIDIDSAQRPGPIPVILGNTFAGGGDDALDLEADAHVEGNLFRNFIEDPFNTASGDANAISAGAGREYTVVRNIFANVDHAVQVKDDAFLTFVNNTVHDVHRSAIYFEMADRGPGRGALVEDSIFASTAVAFDAMRPTTDLTVNRSIVPAAAVGLGTGNLDADPRLADPAAGDFRLRPGSPALGSAPGGLDMGALVPAGASISGAPPAYTSASGATLTVGGPGITHYRYRVGNPPWNAETPVAEPIQLAGLTDGDYSVAVIGKNSAGIWQDEEAPTTSRTWTVETGTARLRINEVLAINDAVVEISGAFPDLVELYNDGDLPGYLSGMGLTDDPGQPARFVFPSGTTLDAGEYLVLIAGDATGAPGLHLGFALNGDGEGLYLYDTAIGGAALLDSVEFGIQVPDLSLGRVGHDAQWALARPTFGAANQVQPTGDTAALKINEWFTAGEVRLRDDFVELYNPDPLPVELSGLYLTDDPVARPDRHQIAPLSFVGGSGFAVFLADDQSGPGADHMEFQLSAQQEMLGLFDHELESIDQLVYYPQTTDMAQGRSPDGSGQLAFSRLPTPGVANPVTTTSQLSLVAIDAVWAYDQSGADLGAGWRDVGFDDSSWPTGAGVLAAEEGALPAEIHTELTTGVVTYYFRGHFTLDADPADVAVELTTLIDDGAVVYINGAELLRLGLPDGEVAFDRRANRGVGNAAWEGPFIVLNDLLVAGENLIAAEVHQISPGNSDVVFGLTLSVRMTSTDPQVASALALVDGLRATEIMYNPATGQEHEFIELQNIGDKPLDLSGVRLGGGIEFVFPQWVLEPGQYVVVAGDLHSFMSHYGGSVNLTGPFGGRLSNGGEEIELVLPAPYDAAILRFEYDDGWHPPTDGGGRSLVIVNTAAELRSWDEPASWRASLLAGGSPGMGDRPRNLGDMNFDGEVDPQDVAGFVLGLSHPDAYAVTYGVPASFNGDVDGDGDLDFDDIQGFVSLFGSGTPTFGDVHVRTRRELLPKEREPAPRFRWKDQIARQATIEEELAAIWSPDRDWRGPNQWDWL